MRGRLIITGAVVAAFSAPVAADAAVRFASPTGSGGACSQAAPCLLTTAIDFAAIDDGDEVVLLPGVHDIGSSGFTVFDDILIRGQAGSRPTILAAPGAAPIVFVSDASTAIIRDLRFVAQGGSNPRGLDVHGGATIERVEVQVPQGTGDACEMVNADAVVIRDSICWAGGSGDAISMSQTAEVDMHNALVNVTAVAAGTGPDVRAIRVTMTGDLHLAELRAYNTIAVSNSSSPDILASSSPGTALVTLTNSNYATVLQAGTGVVTPAGSGSNQTSPPVFANAATGDFHQLIGSPTVNAGADSFLLGPTDFEGDVRFQGTLPDIGADEFDEIAPVVTITGGPAEGATVTTDSTGFSFESSEPANFACSVDGGAPGSCSGASGLVSSGSHSIGPLAEGQHTFSVSATDANGNAGASVTRGFTVDLPDTQSPNTTITKGLPKKTEKDSAKFKFRSTEAGSSFLCKLDRKPFRPCASPKTYRNLDPGKHVFRVKATDAAGNTDGSAAVDRWTVLEG